MLRVLTLLAMFVSIAFQTYLTAQEANDTPDGYDRWENGISGDPAFFPIAVWLQSPHNAERFKQAGINLYIGLWDGPSEEQLVTLKRTGMPVICSQNDVAMNSEHADLIVGWMHGDEPDNAQARRSGGYGPPIEPSVIEKQYNQIKLRDSTRPILLNLGQGVAYDNYIGRGVRRNRPEDYPLYIRGSDIVSFDIYPAVHDQPEVAGKLEFVPRGVERLRRWSNNEKIVWNCIEASRISNEEVKPTPEQIRAEVWMSLIRGSRGLIYFVHQFEPTFKEASLLDDPELLAAVTSINRQIIELAPVLNSRDITDAIVFATPSQETPIQVLVKRHAGSLYLLASNESPNTATAILEVTVPLAASAKLKPLAKESPIEIRDSKILLELPGYGIGLYRLDESSPRP